MTARDRGGPSGLAGSLALACLLAVAFPPRSQAARYTPGAWQQPIMAHRDSTFLEQRKHLGWNRDRDTTFIDDEIERRYGPGDRVDVLVELNECLQPRDVIALLSPFGRVAYVGQLVSCAYVHGVSYAMLKPLAHLPQVAMVEWQTPFQVTLGSSTRAIQAAESKGAEGYGAGQAARNADGEGWTGEGVNIAIVDTGVFNGHMALPGTDSSAGAIVAGFDATQFEDENGDGIDDSTAGTVCAPTDVCGRLENINVDPGPVEPDHDHGTVMASIALGRWLSSADRASLGVTCGTPTDEESDLDCGGVAPRAGLVDVRVCTKNEFCCYNKPENPCDPDVMQGIDWIGLNHVTHSIRVANFSISDDTDCDGTCAICSAVNYLGALGIVPVAALGNAEDPGEPGTRKVGTPAAASYAITVAGTNDQGSVKRDDDLLYSKSYIGPRLFTDETTTGPLGDKPDISAPGEEVQALNTQGSYVPASGTSEAAAHVSGAAALLIQAMEAPSTATGRITPGHVKDLLLSTADNLMNGSVGGVPVDASARPLWDPSFGRGMLDVHAALTATRVTDLRFPTCAGDASASGEPCPLSGGLNKWQNWEDITVTGELVVGNEITITAEVKNDGLAEAENFLVSFGVYDYGTGSNLFCEVGTLAVDRLAAGATGSYSVAWTLLDSDHQCVQVTISYGLDENGLNNTTQRNLEIAASRYVVRVENPYMVPATFRVRARSERAGWPCTVQPETFTIGGPGDCARLVNADFYPGISAQPGDSANCNIEVFARRAGEPDGVSIGGVTARTFVPTPCRIRGEVLDLAGTGIPKVALSFKRDLPPGVSTPFGDTTWETKTREGGRFELNGLPDARQILIVSFPDARRDTLRVRPRCDRPLRLRRVGDVAQVLDPVFLER